MLIVVSYVETMVEGWCDAVSSHRRRNPNHCIAPTTKKTAKAAKATVTAVAAAETAKAAQTSAEKQPDHKRVTSHEYSSTAAARACILYQVSMSSTYISGTRYLVRMYQSVHM